MPARLTWTLQPYGGSDARPARTVKQEAAGAQPLCEVGESLTRSSPAEFVQMSLTPGSARRVATSLKSSARSGRGHDLGSDGRETGAASGAARRWTAPGSSGEDLG
jgi:hypothetical protein